MIYGYSLFGTTNPSPFKRFTVIQLIYKSSEQH